MATIAGAVVELQDRQYQADDDPTAASARIDARAALQTARSAVDRLRRPTEDQRRASYLLILFEPRR
ncbi:valine--tRNA ligase [Methylobacterium sp. J-030]|uniref:valine--tRNA ligase n=1 Tax=Methylobacterium sp. J-030 TaxID=2836627 RepID=UPI001FB8EF2A|nr:valine--tRNA ligase [Methylobacterium sp. J-030]MCJ2071870.1 valine--tRNA ligase [Methylobacterium sp. J-030]